MEESVQILIAKYITGEANADEIIMAEKWVDLSPENETYYWEIYHLWHILLAGSNKELVNVNKAFSQILERKKHLTIVHKRKRMYKIITAAAAAIILFMFIGNHLMEQSRISKMPSIALQEVSVQANSKKMVLLPDSTVVWINAESAIKWDNNFNINNRIVYLEGEAYFDVAASVHKIPFIVKTARFTIRDIGTIFNIKSFSGLKTFETVVIEGSVSVQENSPKTGANEPILLKKNEVLKINSLVTDSLTDKRVANPNMQLVEIKRIEKPDVYIAWKDDLLVFDGASFADVAGKLEKRFNIHIEFDKTRLGDFKYSGSFSNQTALESILDVIAETTPINYEMHGTNIIIRHK